LIATFKETDLFKVFQTGDLGSYYNRYIDNHNSKDSELKQEAPTIVPTSKRQKIVTQKNKQAVVKKEKQHDHQHDPPTMPQLLALLKSIYSSEFRDFIRWLLYIYMTFVLFLTKFSVFYCINRAIMGCDELTSRVDCSVNAYANR